MRVLKASIQTAATKVTNIGVRLSSEASLCLRQIPIYSSKFSITSLTAEATAITTVKRANGDILSSYNWTKPTIIYWFKHIY